MYEFTLYDLSALALAVEKQKQVARDEYADKMRALDHLSDKIRQHIDALQATKKEELAERGFYNEEEPFYDE